MADPVVSTAEIESLRLAILAPEATFPDRHVAGPRLEHLAPLEAALTNASDVAFLRAEFDRLRREALLANPLLDGISILCLRRKLANDRTLDDRALGLPQNWQGNCALPPLGHTNQIVRIDPARPDDPPEVVFELSDPVCLADLEPHWDGRRLLFSMPAGPRRRWQVFELVPAGGAVRQITRDFPQEIDNYDPAYLPDGDIVFASTACVAGVPCVGESTRVANLFRCHPDGSRIRQLCVDQEHNWCPAVIADGRVMYTRWEYTDTPHYFTRLLFTMNPDGSNQRAVYGSNS